MNSQFPLFFRQKVLKQFYFFTLAFSAHIYSLSLLFSFLYTSPRRIGIVRRSAGSCPMSWQWLRGSRLWLIKINARKINMQSRRRKTHCESSPQFIFPQCQVMVGNRRNTENSFSQCSKLPWLFEQIAVLPRRSLEGQFFRRQIESRFFPPPPSPSSYSSPQRVRPLRCFRDDCHYRSEIFWKKIEVKNPLFLPQNQLRITRSG